MHKTRVCGLFSFLLLRTSFWLALQCNAVVVAISGLGVRYIWSTVAATRDFNNNGVNFLVGWVRVQCFVTQ